MDFDPYQALGVPPTARKSEITAAYRLTAQLYHPDRWVDAAEPVRHEAERRMKELNEAYRFARKAMPSDIDRVRRTNRDQTRERKKAEWKPPTNFGVPWEVAQRERAQQSAKAHAERMAREAVAHNGRAVAKTKPPRQYPTTLWGMGEALHTNKVTCRTCKSLEWLPGGWSARLDEYDYFCSSCDRLLISRRFVGK